MMQEFYDKFHPTVKDVEANAERERRKNFSKDPKQVSRSVRLGSLDLWLKLEKRMMKRKICQFNARSKYWKYWLEEALIFCFQRFRGI
jgi:DNA topoisomerase-1